MTWVTWFLGGFLFTKYVHLYLYTYVHVSVPSVHLLYVQPQLMSVLCSLEWIKSYCGALWSLEPDLCIHSIVLWCQCQWCPCLWCHCHICYLVTMVTVNKKWIWKWHSTQELNYSTVAYGKFLWHCYFLLSPNMTLYQFSRLGHGWTFYTWLCFSLAGDTTTVAVLMSDNKRLVISLYQPL